MAKGENIFKRKDGRWEARYIKGHELSGKIIYGFCYGKTYKEAKEKVTKFKADIINGKDIGSLNSKHRFNYYCDEWLKQNKNKIKNSTYVKYETIIEKHIKPKLGSCYPTALNTNLIELFSDKLIYEDGLSPKTAKDILSSLRSVLKYTSKQFNHNFPRIDISYPKDIKKEMRVLSKEEQSRFIQYLIDDIDSCKFGVIIALYTGIRIGELCALRWNNISIKDKIIKITSTMQRLKDVSVNPQAKTTVVINSPKSNTSSRIIPMTDYITALCKEMNPQSSNAFILTGNENFMEPRTLQYRLGKYTKECCLEGVHFHTLRHTFATRCIEAGFEIKSLSEILGHSTTTITLDRYVHSSIELKRDNMQKLADMRFDL